MEATDFNPMDLVTWFRTKPGSINTAQKIPAVVSHRAKTKVVIRVKDPSGNELLRWVTPDQLERRGV